MIQISQVCVNHEKMHEVQTSTSEQVKEAVAYIEKEMQKKKKVACKKQKQQKKKTANNKLQKFLEAVEKM